MRYSPIEQEVLNKLAVTDVGNDCIELCRIAVQQSYHSPVDDRQLMVFISNLYAKLHEDGRIRSRNNHGMIDLLNDMIIFKLHTPQKLFAYVIGQLRTAA